MNKYETIETIGEGEYGVVLKAINKETSELVAIKKFKEDDTEPETKKVILREVKILKTLNHENIIELKEAFRKKGKIYLVCEYVEKNLLEILEEGQLNPQRVKNFAYQMLKGIDHMHSQNIIHRDIKPENLLINKMDELKICDLGFARFVPTNGKMTDYVATRWYRPPELLIGKENYDISIDIWSIGCVMAEMIDGEPLFGGENDLDQLYQIQKCLGPLISDHEEFFLKNPKFVGMKFPEINAIESIDRRYLGKIDKLGLDLLKKMLRMNPKERITPEQALLHPFFNRLVTPLERDSKKSSLIDAKHVFDREEKSELNNKSHLHVNNFLQEKNKKNTTREDRMGLSKVLGLSKPQREKSEEIATAWMFSAKGKSLGKKPAGSLREREVFNEKLLKVKVKKEVKKHDEEEEYADDWDEIDKEEEKKGYNNEKSDRRLLDKSEEKSIEKKRKKKVFKKESVNIVFNQNTYNLNVVENDFQ